MLERGEVVGEIAERSNSPLRSGKRVELRGKIDDLPALVSHLEATVGRAFFREEAQVIASLGEAIDDQLATRVRAWLGTSPRI
jgi:hypothetical protein